MRCQYAANDPPDQAPTWAARWEGPDEGLLCAWLRGLEKAREDPALAAKALAGELPVLAWKGGVEKAIKSRTKVGTLLYLATWLGLRGQDLDLDTDAEMQLTCSRTGVTVSYTRDTARLLAAGSAEE